MYLQHTTSRNSSRFHLTPVSRHRLKMSGTFQAIECIFPKGTLVLITYPSSWYLLVVVWSSRRVFQGKASDIVNLQSRRNHQYETDEKTIPLRK